MFGILGNFKSLSSLSKDERSSFLEELQQSSRPQLFYIIKFGAASYTLFFIYDLILLPQLWKHFLVVRLMLVIPTLAYVLAVERGFLRFGVETKMLMFAPVTWATSYAAVTVPRDLFVIESSLNILLVLTSATLVSWLIHEFICYAIAVMIGSALIWHQWTTLSVQELTIEYFMNISVLGSSLLLVQMRVAHDINDFLHKKQLLRHEWAKVEAKISAIEWRLADADRNAYLAKHLGLFLYEIKNTLLSIDVAVTSGATTTDRLIQNLEIVKGSGDQTRKLIETFLERIKAKEVTKEILSIDNEMAAVLPLIRFHTEKNGMTFEDFVAPDIGGVEACIMPGALSLTLFNITRFAINSLNKARFYFPGQTFAGRIGLSITKTNGNVVFVLEDNGIGLSEDESGELPSEDANGLGGDLQAGLSFLGLRSKADENGIEVKLEPRLGGGTVATVTVPIYSPLSSASIQGNRGTAA